MDVILRMLGHVIVDDVADLGDVQPARRNVRSHEHFEAAIAKAAQGLLAFALGAVGVQHGHRMVASFEQMGHAVGAVLGAAEDDDGVIVDSFEQLEQQVGLLRVGHGINHMLDVLGRRATRADLNGLRLLHRPVDLRLDFGRNGGGKQGGVPLARAFLDDAPHVGQETHVKHAVSFIQHEELNAVESAAALLHEVQQPARRGNQHVQSVAQGIFLQAVTDAAENDGHAQIREPGEVPQSGLDLGGEFAGRFKDQHAGLGPVLAELGQDRQGESGRFARAGLGTADDILAGHNERNGAKLDGRRLDIAHGFDAIEHGRGKTKFAKSHGSLRVRHGGFRRQIGCLRGVGLSRGWFGLRLFLGGPRKFLLAAFRQYRRSRCAGRLLGWRDRLHHNGFGGRSGRGLRYGDRGQRRRRRMFCDQWGGLRRGLEFGFGRPGQRLLGRLERSVGEFDDVTLVNEPVKVGNNRGLLGRGLRRLGGLTRLGRLGWRIGGQGIDCLAPGTLGFRIDVIDNAFNAVRNGGGF